MVLQYQNVIVIMWATCQFERVTEGVREGNRGSYLALKGGGEDFEEGDTEDRGEGLMITPNLIVELDTADAYDDCG